MEYKVIEIPHKDTYPFLLEIHYAKRIPSISYAYGLYRDGDLVGVITYGTPFSSPLRNGVCGKENAQYVLELNRLCLKDNLKNEASILIGKSLKLLPKPTVIISFADSSQGHVGTVYQATNFIYTGLSAKRTDWKIKGKEHLHSQTIADEFRGQKDRVKLMREKYGDDFYLAERPRKHRYIFINGDKRFKKMILKALKYPIEDYPKSNH